VPNAERGPFERGSSPGRRRRKRSGRVRTWVPLFLVFWFGVWLFESLTSDVIASGYTTIDTRRARLDGAGGFSPAWQGWMARSLARVPAPTALDAEGIDGVVNAIADLPFVAEIGSTRVAWPDGIEVAVRLRQPVACVLIGNEYFAVAADGVILPGSWSAPPWVHAAFLPVIGPNDHSCDGLRPGDALKEQRHVDGLAVACSMRLSLSRTDFELMGPALIDATRARRASVTEPGVLLKLDGRRLVFFGRVPNCGEPGELPAEFKWSSLSRALQQTKTEAGARDWSVLDVRWDVPAIQWRDASGG